MSAWTSGRRPSMGPPSLGGGEACMGLQSLGLGGPHADALLRTVETEIIPRLMLLHGGLAQPQARAGRAAPAVPLCPAPDDDEVERFTNHLLQGHELALAHLKRAAARGLPAPELCLGLLAPAARRLGELWTADLCDFTQVTIALGRLQGLLHVLTRGLASLADGQPPGGRVVFAPAPGEQHTFGLSMVRDFFRSAGWDVWADTPESPDALLALLRRQPFDLVGFSIGSERNVKPLEALIQAVRRESGRRRLRVMVGGPLLLQHPELAPRLGADATADDARQAILAAHTLLAAQDEGR